MPIDGNLAAMDAHLEAQEHMTERAEKVSKIISEAIAAEEQTPEIARLREAWAHLEYSEAMRISLAVGDALFLELSP